METLAAYFAAGRVATDRARALHIGARTVTYRLKRVEELTGYSADDPVQGLGLHIAVLGGEAALRLPEVGEQRPVSWPIAVVVGRSAARQH